MKKKKQNSFGKSLYKKKFMLLALLTFDIITCILISSLLVSMPQMFGSANSVNIFEIPLKGIFSKKGLDMTMKLFLISIPVILIAAMIMAVKSMVKDNKDESNYGTASMMTEEEKEEILNEDTIENTLEDILGINPDNDELLVSRKSDAWINKMKIVCGNPGTWKSRAIIKPDIFQAIRRGESIIVVDTKGDLYNTTAKTAMENGYEVKLFNLVDLKHSDSCNFMAGIGDDILKGQEFVGIVMANILGKDVNSGDFWDLVEVNLFLAVTMFISADPCREEEEKNLAEIYSYIATRPLNLMLKDMDSISPNHPAYAPFSIFKSAEPKVQIGAKTGIATKLQIFQAKEVRDIISKNDIDLTAPGRKKCVHYVLISDQTKTFKLLSSLYFSYAITKLVEMADNTDNQRLDIPVNLIMDEFCNVGYIDNFLTRVNTVRSRGISITMVIQDYGQLKDTYGELKASSLISACDVNIFLGGNEIDNTAHYYEKRGGIETIEVESQRYTTDIFGNRCYVEQGTRSKGKRNLYNADELLKMDNNFLLVYIRGHNPLMLKKYDFLKHPLYDKNKKLNASKYKPEQNGQNGINDVPVQQLAIDNPNPGKLKPLAFFSKRNKKQNKPVQEETQNIIQQNIPHQQPQNYPYPKAAAVQTPGNVKQPKKSGSILCNNFMTSLQNDNIPYTDEQAVRETSSRNFLKSRLQETEGAQPTYTYNTLVRQDAPYIPQGYTQEETYVANKQDVNQELVLNLSGSYNSDNQETAFQHQANTGSLTFTFNSESKGSDSEFPDNKTVDNNNGKSVNDSSIKNVKPEPPVAADRQAGIDCDMTTRLRQTNSNKKTKTDAVVKNEDDTYKNYKEEKKLKKQSQVAPRPEILTPIQKENYDSLNGNIHKTPPKGFL